MSENGYYIWNAETAAEETGEKQNDVEIRTKPIFKTEDYQLVSSSTTTYNQDQTGENLQTLWNANNDIDDSTTFDSPVIIKCEPKLIENDTTTSSSKTDTNDDYVIKTVSFQGRKPPDCALTIVKNIHNYVKMNHIRGLTNARMLSDASGVAYNLVKRIINGQVFTEREEQELANQDKNKNSKTGKKKRKMSLNSRKQKKVNDETATTVPQKSLKKKKKIKIEDPLAI